MSVLNVNGTTDKSAFISHLASYPLISDSFNTITSHPLGQKSFTLIRTSISHIQHLIPFYGPYSKLAPYLAPLLSRADSFGDSTLNSLDTRVPAVKKPTGELYDDTKGLVFLPLRKSVEGKEYVIRAYEGEVKKIRGEGYVTYGKAAIATGFIVVSDMLAWAAGFMSKKKGEAKGVVNEKVHQ